MAISHSHRASQSSNARDSDMRKKTTYVEPDKKAESITTDMRSHALEGMPDGFQFSAAFSRKLRVMENKNDDVTVKGALKVKTMAITNITKDTEDADIEKLVKGVGSIESFRKAYNLDKMRTKQFTFQVLD